MVRFTNKAWDNIDEVHLKKVLNYPIQQKIEELERRCFKKALQRSKYKKGSMMWYLKDNALKELIVEKQNLINKLK
jgi:hypothetical protein